MRAAREAKNGWEKALSRFFAANGVDLRWNYIARRFEGVSGHIFARINPQKEENVWKRMPEYVKRYEKSDRNIEGKQVVILATNRQYGDSVEDTLVVLRLGTFAPMLKAFIQQDIERWKE